MNYLEPAGSASQSGVDQSRSDGRVSVAAERPREGHARRRGCSTSSTRRRALDDAQQYLDLRTMTAPPYFPPYQQPNPFYATGNAFAPPRRLYLSAIVAF